ncbi:hypothetical protein SK128_019920, partial [Halocaridina rubra]
PEYNVFEPQVSWGEGGDAQRQPRDTPQVPRLHFEALGRSFSFRLSPNEVLTSPNFVFLARKVDGNELRPTRRDQLSCYYQGVDDSHSETLIAVELCGPVVR